jgi:hypothetical protein
MLASIPFCFNDIVITPSCTRNREQTTYAFETITFSQYLSATILSLLFTVSFALVVVLNVVDVLAAD